MGYLRSVSSSSSSVHRIDRKVRGGSIFNVRDIGFCEGYVGVKNTEIKSQLSGDRLDNICSYYKRVVDHMPCRREGLNLFLTGIHRVKTLMPSLINTGLNAFINMRQLI